MADEILIFDAAASNPDGTDPGSPLSIGPGTSYPITEASFPAPPQNILYSSSADTEGEVPVSRRYGNRTITLRIEIDESGANDTLLSALQAKFAKLQLDGGTLKRTRKDGTTVRIYDILAADGWDPAYDLKYILGHSSEVQVSLPAKPLARGTEIEYGYLLDDFSTNTIANYTFDAGGGTLSVSGGQLVPSSTASKILYHPGYGQWPDTRASFKFTTGASVATYENFVVLKRLNSTNYLMAGLGTGAASIYIYKVVAGAPTALATGGVVVLSTATNYWVRAWIDGNNITVEQWTSAPTPGGTPLNTLSHTLAGGDATQFGAGVSGSTGMRLVPQATDWRYDDFKAEAFIETTEPALIFTQGGISGDANANGQFVLNNDGTIAWWGVIWGLESRNYNAAATAAPFYEVEGRTAMGGSATAVGPAGASGGGSNVMRNTALTNSYQAILSTQATGAGAHLSHVGSFRVLARVQVPATNTGTVTIGLEWGEGDYLRVNTNPPVALGAAYEGAWLLVDMGPVTLRAVTTGTQRWEGRVLARSTVVGDDIDVDWLMIVPVKEGSGVAQAVASSQAPTSLTGRDDFLTLGVGTGLNARVAPTGGTWATSGAATDLVGHAGFVGDGFPNTITRASTGTRFGVLGTTVSTSTGVSVVVLVSFIANSDNGGVLARWVDSSNYLACRAGIASCGIDIVIAGVSSTLASSTLASSPYVRVEAYVSPLGDVIARFYNAQTGGLIRTLTASHAALATGGALDDGKVGIIDTGLSSGGGPYTKMYDGFQAWVPPTDAGVFAGQSIEWRADGVQREDSTGAYWQQPSSYIGDYLTLPPAGAEGRTLRMIAKPLYHPPLNSAGTLWLDDRIDRISARLFVTPRFLT